MKIHPLSSVDSQILHQEFQPLDGDRILRLLVEAAELVGLTAEDCVQQETGSPHDISVQISDLKVSVVQSIPFAEDDYLQVALDTFSLENFIKGDQRIDDAVTACTHVSVQPLTDSTVTALKGTEKLGAGDLAVFEDTRSALRAMSFTKTIVSRLLEETDAVSVFWGPSTFLLEPDTFKRLAASKEELLLYLHCHLFSEDDPKTGETLTGVVAAGAQWLVGRYVEIKPCPLPPEYLVEKVYDFVRTALKSDSIGTDGQSFGRDDDEDIKVRLEPPEGYAPGRVLLQVVPEDDAPIADETDNDPEAEPDAPLSEATHTVLPASLSPLSPAPEAFRPPSGGDFRDFDDEDRELDPNDPVDAAILQRLAELNETDADTEDKAPGETASAPVEEEPASAEEEEIPAEPELAAITVQEEPITVEPEQRPRRQKPQPKRMSMDELRNFAKEAQVSQKDRDVPSRKRGFIGKMFNGKSG
ncbi:hypothetical protein [Roseibium sp.]|uniref:hypothetical protein n=1 Tax=Roseibium sp. TaxID=1936156 RepID=UPI003B50E79B